VSVVLLIAILAVVQVVAERHNVRFDLTPSRRLSVSETTRQILEQLEDAVHIEAFYRRERRQEVADLLQRLTGESARVRCVLFDIDRYPDRARAAGVRAAGRARVTYRGMHTVVSTASEEYVAGGILRVLRGEVRQLYFLVGHGEGPLADVSTPEAYGLVLRALRAENADARTLDLAGRPEVPANADTVVVAGPRRDLLQTEIEALDTYLARDGALLALLDPAPLPRLRALLERYTVRLGDDIIVDRTNRLLGAEDLVVRVPYYRMHAVTAPTDVPAVFVGTRTVDAMEATAVARAQVVARTVESGWATREIDAARRGEATYHERRDRPGPLPVMVAASLGPNAKGSRGGRLVVIGDADFATNGYIDLLGNRDLLLNSLSWLTDEEALIARRPREIAEIARPLSPLVLTERQARLLFVAVVVAEPGFFLLLGTAIVAVRRRRG
jgi:ABC-type uncharacterized transport system involved in gliding motility auxiliary subunit